MTSTSKKITFKVTQDRYQCGDGCCDWFDETATVTMPDGEEFEVEVNVDKEKMYAMILAKLGYEIEEDED